MRTTAAAESVTFVATLKMQEQEAQWLSCLGGNHSTISRQRSRRFGASLGRDPINSDLYQNAQVKQIALSASCETRRGS